MIECGFIHVKVNKQVVKLKQIKLECGEIVFLFVIHTIKPQEDGLYDK